jgi:hypothetical protein
MGKNRKLSKGFGWSNPKAVNQIGFLTSHKVGIGTLECLWMLSRKNIDNLPLLTGVIRNKIFKSLVDNSKFIANGSGIDGMSGYLYTLMLLMSRVNKSYENTPAVAKLLLAI